MSEISALVKEASLKKMVYKKWTLKKKKKKKKWTLIRC